MPDGSEFGPVAESDLCALISLGRLPHIAYVSIPPALEYFPIFHVPIFHQAYTALAAQQAAYAAAEQQIAPANGTNGSGGYPAYSPPVPQAPPSQTAEGFLFDEIEDVSGTPHGGRPGVRAITEVSRTGETPVLQVQVDVAAAYAGQGTPLPGYPPVQAQPQLQPMYPLQGQAMPGYAPGYPPGHGPGYPPGYVPGYSPPAPAPLPATASMPSLTPLPMQVELQSPAATPLPSAVNAVPIDVSDVDADPANPAVAAYLHERQEFEAANRELETGRYLSAKEKFENLVALRPKTSEYAASAAWADFLLASDEKGRFAAAGKLREVHEAYPYCVTTLLYTARASRKINRPKAAVRYLKSALTIEPDRRDLQQELQLAQDAVDGKVSTGESSDKVSTLASLKSSLSDKIKSTATAGPRTSSRARAANEDDEVNPKKLIETGIVCAVLWAFLLTLSVLGEMGKTEYFYKPDDAFWWIRRIVLLGAGVGLPALLMKDEWPDKSDFVADPKWLVAALGIGVAVGFLSPWQSVQSPMGVVLTMTVIHVVAEESFFRLYLARALQKGFGGGIVAPVSISALLYGLYHWTYWVMFDSSAVQAWSAVGMIALGAGVPYAVLYYMTRSFTVPILCHLAVNATMMILSYEHIKL